MRSVLVCVRTTLAAQAVASYAARLGLATAVRTALSEADVMARLADRPADLILADTALTRPDSAGFTRRVLARAPGAVIVLFGAEDPRVAAAAVSAGARALIRGGEDPVSTVAKTIMLLGAPARALARTGAPAGAAQVVPAAARPGTGRGVLRSEPPAGGEALHPPLPTDPVAHPAAPGGGAAPGGNAPPAGPPGGHPAAGNAGPASQFGRPGATVVPAQRGDFGEPDPSGSGRATGYPPHPSPGSGGRRVMLTERELQVLRGMADGKSNAEIGRELFVSEDTVKTHARRLFRKLGARDRAHAVAAGFRAGLVA
ncbi:MAG TPA: helix-turn-helix transcriptional regulator [Pilimelia sp.]|nr:helix-turn-helix transcriptional regulator [Pilimelia sp.]